MGWNMSRWNELPETLGDRSRQLVVQLRRLKDHSGLSLTALASKTAYSRSSWERYLNGKQLPPAEAIEALARTVGVDPARLLALREVAGSVVVREELPEPAVESEPVTAAAGAGPEPSSAAAPGMAGPGGGEPRVPPPRRSTRLRRIVAGTVGLLVLVSGALLAATAPWEGETERSPLVSAHEEGPYEWDSTRQTAYKCEIQQHKGRTYAGHSATGQVVLENNSTSWEVVEAQCLVRHAGFDPGAVDGVYGDDTQRAVQRLQAKAGIVDDGEVGPETWGVLRR